MKKKRMSTLLLLLLVTLSVPVLGATWIGGDPNDPSWVMPGNWDTGVVPDASEGVIIGVAPNEPNVTDGISAEGLTIYIRENMDLNVLGGSVTAADPNGIPGNFWIGWGSLGTLNVSGGTVSGVFEIGRNARGVVNVTGDTVLDGNISIGRNVAGSVINLDSGLLDQTSGAFSPIGTSAYEINITHGEMALNGDETGDMNAGVTAGKISAFGGAATVLVDYIADGNDALFGQTWVRSTPYTKAWDPTPVDDAEEFDNTAVILSWLANGPDIISHQIYFGTVNPPTTLVDTANVGDPNFLTYDPGILVEGQEYFWRIDGFDGATIYEGDVWSFEVLSPVFAKDPSPADGATGVDNEADLSWTAGVGALTHDVYMGVAADALTLEAENLAVTSYDPGTMLKGETYYWRVDEFDGTDTWEGPVWSFTTTGGNTTAWTNADPNTQLWRIDDNWTNETPGVNNTITMASDAVGPVLLDEDTVAGTNGFNFQLTMPVDPNDPNAPTAPGLVIDGGSLQTGTFEFGNTADDNSMIVMNGGEFLASGANLHWGRFGGRCALIMNGGTCEVTATSRLWIARNSDANSNAYIELNGGTFTLTGTITERQSGPIMDISGGTFIWNGDRTGTVTTWAGNGTITLYEGAGTLMMEYDGTNTIVQACPPGLTADMTADCRINLEDFAAIASDWLFDQPETMHWFFDMSSDPVGDGPYDLEVRGDSGTYTMDLDNGWLVMDGAEKIVIENKHQYSAYDMEYTLVAKAVSTNTEPFRFWVENQPSPADITLRSFVGCSIFYDVNDIDPNNVIESQRVQIWDGTANSAGAVIEGLDPDEFITIHVYATYETMALEYTVSQGGSVVAGPDSYTYVTQSNPLQALGGEFALQNSNGAGVGVVDYAEYHIYGPTWWSDYDYAPVDGRDGTVDLLELRIMADEWLMGLAP